MKKIWKIVSLGGILTFLLIIGAIPPAISFLSSGITYVSHLTDKTPFEVTFDPPFFKQTTFIPDYTGNFQQNKIPVILTITKLKGYNITYLNIVNSGLTIERVDNKNNRNSLQPSINWENSFNNNYIVHCGYLNNLNYGECDNIITLKGSVSNCPDCLLGTDSPYRVTIIAQYKISNGELIPVTIPIDIPIR